MPAATPPAPPLDDRALLERLVRFPSVGHESNAAIAEFIADYLERAGCRVQLLPYQPAGAPPGVNLLAWRGPASDGGLTLCGHMDVVPAGEPGWISDPFTLTERHGRFFARGSADMKGFVALAINLLAGTPDAALRRPLALLLTADEETGSLGAQAFARDRRARELLPRSVIVGEPTELRVVRMHKGHLRARVHITGRAAHSGCPHLGESAIERAGPVLLALTQLAAELRRERAATSAFFPECPYPALNVGVIRGGRAVNIVADSCELLTGLRLLPGQRSEDYVQRMHEALERLPADIRAAVRLELLNDSPPLLCDAAAPVCAQCTRLLGQHETVGVPFASDAGTLAAAGLDCVLFGPGQIENAHRANESLDIRQWHRARQWLDRFIRNFCVESVDERT